MSAELPPDVADIFAKYEEKGRAREIVADDFIPAERQRLYDGMAFAEYATDSGPSLWGEGDRCLWSPGEPLMLYGPQGVGKTTLAQQLIRARAGVEPILFGLPVEVTERKILYVAADRPVQASRSWRRMVAELGEHDRRLLRERITFWRGPLPFDIGAEPESLVKFCEEHEAGTIVTDSLKDLAIDLSKDEVGSRVNRAWQLVLAEGIDVLDLHHPRKSVAGQGSRPKSLDEVYGSTWLTAGHGSVVLIWGQPGDPIVEFSHLKQPIEEVGPFRVLVDHTRGNMQVHEGGDVYAIVKAAPEGLTALDIAAVLFETAKPSPSQKEKARRRADQLVAKGLVQTLHDGSTKPVIYLAASQGKMV